MENETIEEIVREMRERTSRSASEAFYDRESWLNLCDRIEAAARGLPANSYNTLTTQSTERRHNG